MSSKHTLHVRIPEGSRAGENLTVQAEDGRLFAIIIPEGLSSGDLLAVEVDDGVSGGTSVVRAEPAAQEIAHAPRDDGSKASLGAAAVVSCAIFLSFFRRL